jgi:hypothetical protein
MRPSPNPLGAGERHYTPEEIADLWRFDVKTIREMFRNEAGVLKFGKPASRSRRTYTTLRIPESVMQRVYRRMTA